MKKKSLVFALLASMMLSMTACGSDAAETDVEVEADVEVDAETEAEVEVEAETEAEVETETEAEAAVEEAEAEEVVVEEETEEANGEYAKGTVDGNVFESEWIGIRFEAPEGFTVATEEELDEMIQAGGELVYEDDAEMMLNYAELTCVYELFVQESTVGNPNVSLTVEKVDYTPEEYVALLQQQMDALGTLSMTWSDEAETAEIGGVEFQKYTATVESDGASMTQEYYFRQQEGRMIYFVLTYTDDVADAADSLMSAFTAY